MVLGTSGNGQRKSRRKGELACIPVYKCRPLVHGYTPFRLSPVVQALIAPRSLMAIIKCCHMCRDVAPIVLQNAFRHQMKPVSASPGGSVSLQPSWCTSAGPLLFFHRPSINCSTLAFPSHPLQTARKSAMVAVMTPFPLFTFARYCCWCTSAGPLLFFHRPSINCSTLAFPSHPLQTARKVLWLLL
jgi:hypothetical protein